MHHVVIYSGGMDSYTLLHWVRKNKMEQNDTLHALSFNYGQRHSKELHHAIAECVELHVQHHVISLENLNPLLQGSALTSDIDVPEGHYEAESMKLTVVPGRNTIMLAIAMAYAESLCLTHPWTGHDATVYFGAHAGDHHIYPDCRDDFTVAFDNMAVLATEGQVGILAPFQFHAKGRILAEGLEMGLDYKNTWTCYKGGEKACGVCGSCSERLEAFAENCIPDPIAYELRGDEGAAAK